jgi:deoxyadenosine/deoxycytidine kinase
MFPRVVSIEGNIGSGKSTILELLKQRFKENKTIAFLSEPVDVWREIKDEQGVDLLTNFYNDQANFAFHFQMAAYISRISAITKLQQNSEIKLIVVERSIWTDKNVFAKMLYDDSKISQIEYNIYLKWFDEFSKLINHHLNIYIKTTPEVAFERVKKRNRSGETIPLEYLQKCHKYHDTWLNNNSHILDGNIELPDEANIGIVEGIINSLLVR